MTNNNRSTFRGVAIAAATALSLAGCALSADGFVDDDVAGKTDLPDVSMVKALMTGLGAVDPSRKPVEYKPRSPLVVPPSRTLPEPETGETKVATTGDWPDEGGSEAERIRRMRAADPDRRRIASTPERTSGKVWTPEELARYRRSGGGRKGMDEERNKTLRDSEDTRRLTREELRETIDVKKAKGGGVSARARLTDPPVTYRTPASTAPMAAPSKKEKKKANVMDRAIGGYRHYN